MRLTEIPPDQSIILFDGVCNLCNGFVQFLIERDPKRRFRYASLQSETGRALLDAVGLPIDEIDTVVLIENGKEYTRSDVALRASKHMGGTWPLLRVFYLIPKPIRDAVYDWIARNRYRWFGKKEACMIPTPALKDLFLD